MIKNALFFMVLLFLGLNSVYCVVLASQSEKEIDKNQGSVLTLLKQKRIESEQSKQWNVLHKACSSYTEEEFVRLMLFKCMSRPLKRNVEIIQQRIDQVKKLLLDHENQAMINQQDSDGNTPLHLACINEDKVEIVRILLSVKKIDVNAQNNKGNTPLHWACADSNRVGIVTELLNCENINLSIKNNDGYSAYDYVKKDSSNMDQLFREKLDIKKNMIKTKLFSATVFWLLVVLYSLAGLY